MIIPILFIVAFILRPLLAVDAADWPQDAGNAQRSGYTPEEPTEPWSYAWSFNGPDANGGTGGHKYDAPAEARTIAGGGLVFVPAGNKGLYALRINDGAQAWNLRNITVNAAPVYDERTQLVFAGGSDGKIYKINVMDGATLGSYASGSAINKALLLVDNFVYAVNQAGQLHKVNTGDMSRVWVYNGNSKSDTPAAYSKSRNVIIFATADLYIHALENNSGGLKWRVKPTPHISGWPYTFDKAWPVIAEKHGVVLLRMQLDHNAMTKYPSQGSIFANSFSIIRDWLEKNPENKNLFAINLENGQEKFTPAVGYGSTEGYINGRTYGVMGSQPVVKVWPDGAEVAYIHFRNGQGNPPDYRWDGHMGEMVFDSTTIAGLNAGDLRFINMARRHGGVGYNDIVDEQNPLTMNGSTLIHAHWGASESVEIMDRSAGKGLSLASPIGIKKRPIIIRALKSCANINTQTHHTTCNLTYVTDGGRFWNGPGFWVYFETPDPPGWRVGSGNTAGNSYSAGFLPRYTYASHGYMIVEGNGGEISAFKHRGVSTANPMAIPTTAITIKPTPTSGLLDKVGDANYDNRVNGLDYVVWLNNYGAKLTGASKGDFNNNGQIDGIDYVLWLNNYTI